MVAFRLSEFAKRRAAIKSDRASKRDRRLIEMIPDLADAPAGSASFSGLTGSASDNASLVSYVAGQLSGYQPLDSDLVAIAALLTSSFGRSILEAASASAARALLGLAIGSDVQAYDADLASIAALTTTAFGRGFLDLADASAARTKIGAVIGSDVQAYDADLAAIAALSTTAFGRTFLDLADAPAARTKIGLVIGTDVQAYDADLAAIAALAGQTSYGQSLLTLANQAALQSAADSWTTIKLTADHTAANSTAFANITDGTNTLSYTPPANSDWELNARILIWTTSATNLPRVGVNVPSHANRGYGAINIWQAGATASASVHANGGYSGTSGVTDVQMAAGGVLTASVPYLCEITASGRSGSTPQAHAIQLACESAAANTCLAKRGSFIRTRTI